MTEVNIYQQRRYLLARAMIVKAIEYLNEADPDILEDPVFSELLEVEAGVASLVDYRLRDDVDALITRLNEIDPETLPLSVDIVGTDFVDWE
jgi:hypothetical protein